MAAQRFSILLLCALTGCQSRLSSDLGKDESVAPEGSESSSSGDDDVPEPTPSESDDDGSSPAGDAGVGTAPTLVESHPADGETGVDLEPRLSFVFDRGIRAGSGNMRVVDTASGEVVEQTSFDSSSVAITARRAVVTLGVTLTPASEYSLTLDPGVVTSNDGTPFAGLDAAAAIHFTTRAFGDPALVSTVPENMATGVPVDTDVELEFDQAVVARQGELVIWTERRGTVVQAVALNDAASVSIDGARVVVDLPEELEAGVGYYVTVDRGALVTPLGAEFAGFDDDVTLAFTTADSVPLPPLTLVSTVPADDAIGVDPATNLVLTFSENIEPGSGEVRIFASDGTLFEAIDVESAAATVVGDSLTLDPTASLETASDYYVELDRGVVVSASGVPCEAVTDPTVFSFSTALEALAPLVLEATDPADDAVGVAVDTALTLSFDRPIRAGAGFVRVFGADDESEVVGVDVTDASVVVDANAARLELGERLEPGREYYVLVGAGAFEALDGAAFAGISDPEQWSFVTGGAFGVVALTPEPGATAVNEATDLELTFSEEVVAGSGNVEIRTSEGVTLESVPIDDPRVVVAAGTVTIDLDSLLSPETEYVVVVDAEALLPAGEGVFEGIAAESWSFTTRALPVPGGVADALVLWLDADFAPSLKQASGVRLWADRSGLHNDLRQADEAAQPALASAALGGRSAVRFDGDDDSMSAAEAFQFGAFEGFLVWQSDQAPDTVKRSILINGRNFEVNHGHSPAARNALSVCVGSACTNNQGWHDVRFVPAPVANSAYLWDFGFDAVTTSTFARAQGSAPVVNTAPVDVPTEALNPFSIGGDPLTCSDHAGCYFPGDVAEVLLFSRVLSRDQRLAVTAYLRDKWGIPEPSCGSGEQLGPNGSCYALSSTRLDFDDARAACVARGSGWDLATVRSAQDDAFVVGLLSEDTWVGGSDDAVEGTWTWLSDGLPFWSGGASGTSLNGAFAAWADDEPTEGTGDDCLRYDAPDLSWADTVCTNTLASLCEGPGD